MPPKNSNLRARYMIQEQELSLKYSRNFVHYRDLRNFSKEQMNIYVPEGSLEMAITNVHVTATSY